MKTFLLGVLIGVILGALAHHLDIKGQCSEDGKIYHFFSTEKLADCKLTDKESK